MIYNYNDLYEEIYINGKNPSSEDFLLEIDNDFFYQSVEKNHHKLTKYLIENYVSKKENSDFYSVMSLAVTLCSRNGSVNCLKEIVDYFDKNNLNLNVENIAINFSFSNKDVFNILKKYIDKNFDNFLINTFIFDDENSALYEVIEFFGVEKIEAKTNSFGYSKGRLLEAINDKKLESKLIKELSEELKNNFNKNKRKI